MSHGQLTVSVAGTVATVTIDHQAKRNAMTSDMWRQLPILLDRLGADPAVRVLVLTGAGDTFSAGADIADLAAVGADSADSNLAVAAEERLAAFGHPTIARIAGHCVGGGCQLALACDFRIAASSARFGVTPARLGIVYPPGSTARLVQTVGVSAAKRLLFTADLVDAERALSWRLVDELAPADELDERVDALTAVLASRSALSQAAAKELIALAAQGRQDPDRVRHWMREVRDSGEAGEGISAFLERRTPRFPWRSGRPSADRAGVAGQPVEGPP
jgi:enoyl-CoA hydratase/carnithine racemase